MKELCIKNNFNVIVDDEDFKKISSIKWHLIKAGRCIYAYHDVKKYEIVTCKKIKKTQVQKKINKNGICKKYVYEREVIPMHWMILEYNGKLVIDHINGNGLDNRKCNLRIVTQQKNLQNRRLNLNSKTGIKNIYKQGGKYVIEITRDKKMYRKKGFKSIKSAKKHLNELVKKHNWW